ncbi:MAG: hypothetical protein AAF532_16100 [Planctomycetota bacterium]
MHEKEKSRLRIFLNRLGIWLLDVKVKNIHKSVAVWVIRASERLARAPATSAIWYLVVFMLSASMTCFWVNVAIAASAVRHGLPLKTERLENLKAESLRLLLVTPGPRDEETGVEYVDRTTEAFYADVAATLGWKKRWFWICVANAVFDCLTVAVTVHLIRLVATGSLVLGLAAMVADGVCAYVLSVLSCTCFSLVASGYGPNVFHLFAPVYAIERLDRIWTGHYFPGYTSLMVTTMSSFLPTLTIAFVVLLCFLYVAVARGLGIVSFQYIDRTSGGKRSDADFAFFTTTGLVISVIGAAMRFVYVCLRTI